jgi:hypothetical protein
MDNAMAPEQAQDVWEEKINHILRIYPFISRPMLQTALGPGCPSRIWRPVLDSMIERGFIVESSRMLTNPGGRSYTYRILHLACNPLPELSVS